tara:strand:- start:908 stop:2527 length:1620 start_codon:yes stop_codon:yes gene_type:complete
MVTVLKTKPTQTIQGTTGQQLMTKAALSEPMALTLGKAGVEASEALAAADTRIQNRVDIISSSKLADNFETETLTSYNAAIEAGDIIDPNNQTIPKFNTEQEARIQRSLSQFTGRSDAKARLEATLRNRAGAYNSQIIQVQNNATREYIGTKANTEIATLAQTVTNSPEKLRDAFDSVGIIVDKYRDALDPTSEKQIEEAGRSLIMEQAASGLINRGQWKEANALILDNPLLMKYLKPSKRETLNKQISVFAQAEVKSQLEIQQKFSTVERLKKSGLPLTRSQEVAYVTGMPLKETIGDKVLQSMKAFGINEEQFNLLPLPQQAALGGLTIPDTSKDLSKQYDKNGEITPFGATKQIEPFFKDAIKINKNITSIRSAYKSWEGGNKAAGLLVLIQFLKLADGGTAVRGEDIDLAESTLSSYAKFQKVVAQTTEGQAVSDALVVEAMAASESFTSKAFEVSKGFVDDVMEANTFTKAQIGIYPKTYDALFGNVKTVPKVKKPKEPIKPEKSKSTDKPPSVNESEVITVIRNEDGTIKIGD